MIDQVKALIWAEHKFNLSVLEAVEARLNERQDREYPWLKDTYSAWRLHLDREVTAARIRLLTLRKGAP